MSSPDPSPDPVAPAGPATPTATTTAVPAAQAQPPTPVDPAATPTSKWKTLVAYLKDAKDVLAGIAAICAAVLFALNYFATSRALNCFKTESSRNYEMIQTALQINTITASLENTNLSLSRSEYKLKVATPGSPEHEAILKDVAKDKVQSRRYETELTAALSRKTALDQKPPSCE